MRGHRGRDVANLVTIINCVDDVCVSATWIDLKGSEFPFNILLKQSFHVELRAGLCTWRSLQIWFLETWRSTKHGRLSTTPINCRVF